MLLGLPLALLHGISKNQFNLTIDASQVLLGPGLDLFVQLIVKS